MTICVIHSIQSHVCTSHLGETLVNVLDFKKDMGLWHGVLTVSLCGGIVIKRKICTVKNKNNAKIIYNTAIKAVIFLFLCFQAVMNRIHSISVPYAVMKACPLSWVQRVHVHKGMLRYSQDSSYHSQLNPLITMQLG